MKCNLEVFYSKSGNSTLNKDILFPKIVSPRSPGIAEMFPDSNMFLFLTSGTGSV